MKRLWDVCWLGEVQGELDQEKAQNMIITENKNDKMKMKKKMKRIKLVKIIK